MHFGLVRVGLFQFNFKTMQAHKWQEYWEGGWSTRQTKERINSRYLLKETSEGLSIVLLDSKKRVTLALDSFLKKEELDEVMRAWADWVFERDVLRG